MYPYLLLLFIMVPTTFITFLLISIFIFLLLIITFSTPHSLHQVKKRLVVANASNLETTTSVNVEIYHGIPTVAETDTRLWFLGRRKMMFKGVLSKSKVVEFEERNGNNAKSSTTKKKSHCKIEECNHNHVKGEGILNVKHKFSKRNDRYVKVKMYGFVPMNADYHYPRSHPPKNN